MTKAFPLTVLLLLTACAGTQATNRPAVHGAEAWRMAVKPNAARLSDQPQHATPTAVATDAPPEAWQLATRPNAARLAASESAARQEPAKQQVTVSRVNKALPW